MFKNIDFDKFWEQSDYAIKEYVSDFPTDGLIAELEAELGYKLPASYIYFMRQKQNGGIPVNACFPMNEPTSWADDHIAITGFLSIGKDKPSSIGGNFGTRFWLEEWGYPDIGIAICDCPSAGHDMIFLDYRACGPEGEPQVVHVDQESDYEITFVAENFENFICALVSEEVYDTFEDDKAEDLRKAAYGSFSPLLAELCESADKNWDIEPKIRELATQIIEEQGYFSIGYDKLSLLMNDVQFLLYTNKYPDVNKDKYMEKYRYIMQFHEGFCTGGYSPSSVDSWLSARMKEKKIIKSHGNISMTDEYKKAILLELENICMKHG